MGHTGMTGTRILFDRQYLVCITYTKLTEIRPYFGDEIYKQRDIMSLFCKIRTKFAYKQSAWFLCEVCEISNYKGKRNMNKRE
jgi:hypothetical protein